jgi:hypothetical protein
MISIAVPTAAAQKGCISRKNLRGSGVGALWGPPSTRVAFPRPLSTATTRACPWPHHQGRASQEVPAQGSVISIFAPTPAPWKSRISRKRQGRPRSALVGDRHPREWLQRGACVVACKDLLACGKRVARDLECPAAEWLPRRRSAVRSQVSGRCDEVSEGFGLSRFSHVLSPAAAVRLSIWSEVTDFAQERGGMLWESDHDGEQNENGGKLRDVLAVVVEEAVQLAASVVEPSSEQAIEVRELLHGPWRTQNRSDARREVSLGWCESERTRAQARRGVRLRWSRPAHGPGGTGHLGIRPLPRRRNRGADWR